MSSIEREKELTIVAKLESRVEDSNPGLFDHTRAFKVIFVCGHRPKTKELLELLLLFFSICLPSSLKGI